jgi:ion channel
MLLAVAITLVLMSTCAFVHHEVLRALHARLPGATFLPPSTKVLGAVTGAIFSHILQVVIWAGAYYFLADDELLGHLEGQFEDAFVSYLYFSAETYTSLGLGDVYPLGWLRMLAGMEALTGLLMISWTASFTYMEMSRYWPDERAG